MPLKTIYAGLFMPQVGKTSEPDFAKPLHVKPDTVTIDILAHNAFTLGGQKIIVRMALSAPFGYVFSLYTKDGENLFSQYKTDPPLRRNMYFISDFKSGLFKKAD
jgi:hypothetical protein